MAEYSASFREGGAFQFNVETVIDLAYAARDYLGATPTIAIEFVGDHKISSDDLSQLLDDPYMRSLRIMKLKIDGSQYAAKPYRSCTIDIDPEWGFLGTVNVTLRGDRDAAVIARDRIEKILKGCLLWYWPLFRPIGPGFFAFRMCLAAVAVFVSIFAAYTLLRGVPASQRDALTQAGEALILTPFFYQIGAFFRNRLFPKLLFNFGKSADSIRVAAYWRNLVFVGVGLAVATGIVATLITDRFK
ncbi:hypothetical protein RAD16_27675 [Bradyrhizobium sp. 18BD]